MMCLTFSIALAFILDLTCLVQYHKHVGTMWYYHIVT